MPIIKVRDLAWVRLRAPDLDAQEEFLTHFGLTRAARTPEALYMRGTDPVHHIHVTEKADDARRLKHLDYMEVLQRGLRVMDSTAISLCMENRLPIIVFNAGVEGNLRRVVMGEELGSMVGELTNG